MKKTILNEDIRQRITEELKEKKRSRAWLAQELAISRQAMNWMLNHAKATCLLKPIAKILNVEPTWLATGTGDKGIGFTTYNILDIEDFPIYSQKDEEDVSNRFIDEFLENINELTKDTTPHTFKSEIIKFLLTNDEFDFVEKIYILINLNDVMRALNQIIVEGYTKEQIEQLHKLKKETLAKYN